MKNDADIVIIGGGLAGVSAAYHLAKAGKSCLILEAGTMGNGSDAMMCGTASPVPIPYSKMLTTNYDPEFTDIVDRLGWDHAKAVTKIKIRGRDLVTRLAKETGRPDAVRQTGGLAVGDGQSLYDLMDFYRTCDARGFCVEYEFIRGDRIKEIFGAGYEGGVLTPRDTIVSPMRYLHGLLKEQGISLSDSTPVRSYEENADGVKVTTANRGEITADQLVVAANGFLEDQNLIGLLKKYWTFIVSFEDKGANAPGTNDLDHIFHYLNRQDDVLMVGGADVEVTPGNTRSPTTEMEQVQELVRWATEKLPVDRSKMLGHHFGVYANTTDYLPIVGRFSEDSRISYLVGCNGLGFTLLSYGASLLPALMGSGKLSEEQERLAKLLSPRRQTLERHSS